MSCGRHLYLSISLLLGEVRGSRRAYIGTTTTETKKEKNSTKFAIQPFIKSKRAPPQREVLENKEK